MINDHQHTLSPIEGEENLLRLQRRLELVLLRDEKLYAKELEEVRADIKDTEQRLAILRNNSNEQN